jgi:hypothetical protein
LLTTILGAILAAIFQAVTFDQAQLSDITALLRDEGLSATQKIQALNTYKEITDRPWSVIRSIVTTASIMLPMFLMALVYRGFFDKSGSQS